jgi:hypothetical protein
VSGLTDAEREALARCVWGAGSKTRSPLLPLLLDEVDRIVARAVSEALTEAADAIEARFDAATSTDPHDPFCLDEASTTTTEAERNGWLSGLRSAMALVRARTN